MDIKQLEIAQKVYSEIREIDNEIIAIEKAAMEIAEDDCDVSITVGLQNYSKMVEAPISRTTAFFGLDHLVGYGSAHHAAEEQKLKPEGSAYYSEVTVSSALQIFGVMLRDKQMRRDKLLRKLEELGVLTQL